MSKKKKSGPRRSNVKRKSVPKLVLRSVAIADPAEAAIAMYAQTQDAEAAMAVFRAKGGMKTA